MKYRTPRPPTNAVDYAWRGFVGALLGCLLLVGLFRLIMPVLVPVCWVIVPLPAFPGYAWGVALGSQRLAGRAAPASAAAVIAGMIVATILWLVGTSVTSTPFPKNDPGPFNWGVVISLIEAGVPAAIIGGAVWGGIVGGKRFSACSALAAACATPLATTIAAWMAWPSQAAQESTTSSWFGDMTAVQVLLGALILSPILVILLSSLSVSAVLPLVTGIGSESAEARVCLDNPRLS